MFASFGSPEIAGVRARRWLEFVVRMRETTPQAIVQGDIEARPGVVGDVDVAAPRSAWPRLEEDFIHWARGQGIGPVLVCDHVHDALLMVALAGPNEPFYELEVRSARYFRGAKLFDAHQLAGLAFEDPRGFRRLRPGVDAALKLVLNGVGNLGTMRIRKFQEKRLQERLAADPDGVGAAASLFGWSSRAFVRGSNAAASGAWDRRSMLTIEAWAVSNAAVHPRRLVARWRFRAKETMCEVRKAITHGGRRVPGEPAQWIEVVRGDHRVIPTDQKA